MKLPFNHWPLTLSATLAAGVLIGATLFGSRAGRDDVAKNIDRIQEVLSYIRHDYVDTVNSDKLGQHAIEGILERLDPHSSYVPHAELDLANAQLEDNFEGIGVEFIILHDTIQVVAPITGGPSDKAGIRAGDRIVRVNGANVAGIHISNSEVFKKLRGPQGTQVSLSLARIGIPQPIILSLQRGRIPTRSVDISLMTDAITGYIKISRFTASTDREFSEAINSLKKRQMKRLVIDLRDNPGGYLDKAIKVADEFLPTGRTISYTEGKASRYNSTFTATGDGAMEHGDVCVLIDEGSASASEILAGALQDNDRATIVGRRSFGKGLVQMPITLSDGSELRLTISRYHTPSGRWIQKPYQQHGIGEYDNEVEARFAKGELFVEDSIHQSDTMKFKTVGGRTVYGGGGIRPDVFVPLDTSLNNAVLIHMSARYVFDQVAQTLVGNSEKTLKAQGLSSFAHSYTFSPVAEKMLLDKALKEGIKVSPLKWPMVKPFALFELKAALARRLFGDAGLYTVMLEKDNDFQGAIKTFAHPVAKR